MTFNTDCHPEIDNFRIVKTGRKFSPFYKQNYDSMKRLILLLCLAAFVLGCEQVEKERYTGRQQDYQLFQSSDFDFQGTLSVRELTEGGVELGISLTGPTSETDYSYPAHLHFGSYDQAEAPIAFLLNPISASTLKSDTEVVQLSDGTEVDFERMRYFDGHVKIHLANEGPDYEVILVSGNVGPKSMLGFDPGKIAVCGNNF